MSTNRASDLTMFLIGCMVGLTIVFGSKIIDLTNQIQQERYDSAYNSCINTNARNAAATATLTTKLDQVEKHARHHTLQADRASGAFFLLLINDQDPVRNCAAYARAVQQGRAS